MIRIIPIRDALRTFGAYLMAYFWLNEQAEIIAKLIWGSGDRVAVGKSIFYFGLITIFFYVNITLTKWERSETKLLLDRLEKALKE